MKDQAAVPSGRFSLLNLGIAMLMAFVAITAAHTAPARASGLIPDFLTQIPSDGAAGSAAGRISSPNGIATSPINGHIYVADDGYIPGGGFNARIDEFTPWGAFVRAWGWGVADGTSEELQTCTTTCFAGLSGPGVGQLDEPTSVAVDSTGNIYVGDGGQYAGDGGNNRVQKFSPSGDFLLMFGGEVNKTTGADRCTQADVEGGDECGVGITGTAPGQFDAKGLHGRLAVGPDDGIYVGDTERIQKFSSSGTHESQIAIPGEVIHALAIDPSGNFFVTYAQNTPRFLPKADVRKLDPSGVLLETLEVRYPTAIATSSAGDLYAVEGAPHGQSLDPDEVIAFDDEGNPLIPYNSRFFYTGPFEAFFDPLIALATNSAGDVLIGFNNALGSGLTEGKVAVFGPGPVQFEPPPPAAPEIDSQWVASVEADSAVVQAKINPHFWVDTTYYVEYGEADCASSSCAKQPLPPGSPLTDKSVNGLIGTAGIELPDLEPDTTYHYRFVAQSGGSPSPIYGADRTFRTYPPSAAGLPDERVYELVSPPDKGGAEVAVPFGAGGEASSVQPQQSSPAGDAITYTSFSVFGDDPQSAPAASQYLSRRGSSGWLTENITPPYEGGFVLAPFGGFSTDLSHSALIVPEPLLTDDASKNRRNLYLRDNLTGGLTALTTATHEAEISALASNYCLVYAGASASSDRVIFAADGALVEGDPIPAGGEKNLYEWSAADGVRLVSMLPDESSAVPSRLNTFGGAQEGGCVTGGWLLRHAISADGSRIFWNYDRVYGGAKEPLFARLDGAETIQLDAPNAGVAGKGGEGEYWDASVDGSKVFFTNTRTLSAQPTTAGSNDLYRYDFGKPVGERLENLTAHVGEETDVGGVIGASEDGSYVYFVAKGALDTVPNAEGDSAVPGANNLYYWHEGDGVRFIATLSTEEVDQHNWSLNPDAQNARVTPDGRHLAFLSTASLTGFDNLSNSGGACGDLSLHKCPEVFLYDLEDDALSCVSCTPSGARPAGPSTVPTWSTPFAQPRYLSDDGGRVFFDSDDVLDPHDDDGKRDVYEFETLGTGSCSIQSAGYDSASAGCVNLISTGSSSDDSFFLDASSDGANVFLSTRQGLVPRDVDGRYDVYDALVGGTPPIPSVPPCEGEGCRGAGTSAPAPSAPGTGAFGGPGDPAPSRRGCPKGRRAVQRAGKTRCLKAKGNRHRKRAGHDQGRASR